MTATEWVGVLVFGVLSSIFGAFVYGYGKPFIDRKLARWSERSRRQNEEAFKAFTFEVGALVEHTDLRIDERAKLSVYEGQMTNTFLTAFFGIFLLSFLLWLPNAISMGVLLPLGLALLITSGFNYVDLTRKAHERRRVLAAVDRESKGK